MRKYPFVLTILSIGILVQAWPSFFRTAGKRDLIAAEGDPLKDITELQRVMFVMKSGLIARPH